MLERRGIEMSRTRLFARVGTCLVVALMFSALAVAVPTTALALSLTYITQWGGHGSGDTNLWSPDYMTTDGFRRTWIADPGNGRVQEFTTHGSHLGSWSGPSGSFGDISGVALDSNQTFVISEWSASMVRRVNYDGDALLGNIGVGGIGTGDGQFHSPAGVAIDLFGYVYVADTLNHRVQKFRPDGTFVTKWGTLGTGPGNFNMPFGIACDSFGYVYVVDSRNNRVQRFTSDGVFVNQIGDASGDGQLSWPSGVAIGPGGRVWVTDTFSDAVKCFLPDGTFLGASGSSGTGPGNFNDPEGIAIDGEGIYVGENSGDRVQSFALPDAKTVTRVGGSDRYAVAVALARHHWPAYKRMTDVVVACGEDRAISDLLSAGGLAGVYNAPILLTKTKKLSSATDAALRQMRAASGPLAIHVVGGTVSVSKSAYNRIKAIDSHGSVERITGKDRYVLSANIAARVKRVADSKHLPVRGVLIFNAENPAAFYDALAASPMTVRGHLALLGVRSKSVPSAAASVLRHAYAGKPRYVVSSTKYVSASMYHKLGASKRLTNETGHGAASADLAADAGDAGWSRLTNVALVANLADAAVGGPLMGLEDGVVMFTSKNSLPAAVVNRLGIWFFKSGPQNGYVFGNSSDVSNGTRAQFAMVLNQP